MSKEQEGGAPVSFLSVNKSLFWLFILSFSFLSFFIFFTYSSQSLSNDDILLKNSDLFSLALLAASLPFKINTRQNIDYSGVHTIYLQVYVPEGLTKTQIKAIAQKIVKDILSQEYFNSVSIDFGQYGYTEFKPSPAARKNLSSLTLKDYSFTYIFY